MHVLWTVHAAAPHRGGSLDCAFIWAFDMGAIDNKPDFSRPVRHRPAAVVEWTGDAVYTQRATFCHTHFVVAAELRRRSDHTGARCCDI